MYETVKIEKKHHRGASGAHTAREIQEKAGRDEYVRNVEKGVLRLRKQSLRAQRRIVSRYESVRRDECVRVCESVRRDENVRDA